MKILFTGASSLTGCWFVRELAARRHEVTAIFRRPRRAYTAQRAQRVELASERCQPVHECSFGDERFLKLVRDGGPWDVLCHHAADVTDYKSPDFDPVAAVASNTRNLRTVLEALAESGCTRVVLTGSVFEPGEGAGSDELRAVSPYGLSKGLTSQVFRHYVRESGLRLGRFVIANPFGPYEEPRFTTYLARTWRNGQAASVRTPAYVRDNVHVSLLARAYGAFVDQLATDAGYEQINPSQYVESQGVFAERFARAMRPRLGLLCELALCEQTEFPEPKLRINTDPVDAAALEWNEEQAWDELAMYYQEMPLS